MSLTNGDRSRSQINRKRRVRLRQRIRVLRAALQKDNVPAPQVKRATRDKK